MDSKPGTDQTPSTNELKTLSSRIVRGAGWTIAMRLVIRSLGFLSTIIVARLLTPDDYGLIAIATLMAAAADVLTWFNFEVWLIRHPQPSRAHYDTVWSLGVLRGIITASMLAAFALPMSIFFDEPRLAVVIYALAAGILAASFTNVGIVDFQRELKFDRDFRLLAGGKFGGFVITVTLAVIFRNYWALVAGIVATNLLTLILSYRMHSFRPRWSFFHWREAFNFSKWLLMGSLLTFVYLRADTFILGKLGVSQLVGIYAMAYMVANLATSEIVMPIRRVLLPGYAKMMGDPERLQDAFVDGFGVIMLLGMPFALGIGLIADPLVRVMLGDQWLPTIPLIQILSVYALASIGLSNQSPVLLTLGHTGLASAIVAIGVVFLVPSFWYATSRYGLSGGAIAVASANVLLFLFGMVATLRVLRMSPRRVLAASWRTVAGAGVMAFVVLLLQKVWWTEAIWPATLLGLCLAAGALSYCSSVFLLWHLTGRQAGPESHVLKYLK